MARDTDIVLSWPCAGYITQRFGENPQDYQQFGQPGHSGVDIGCPSGTLLGAMADGVIDVVKEDKKGYGKYVKIRHQSSKGWGYYYTLLAHMSNHATFVGKTVKAGETIGYSGSTGNSTGPHVHCELMVPWDPAPGYKYGVTNITDYLGNTVPRPGGTGVVINPGPAVNQIVQPGTAIINSNGVNVRLKPSLSGQILGSVNMGMVLDYGGGYIDADGRRWLALLVYVADDLADQKPPLTTAEHRLQRGPR